MANMHSVTTESRPVLTEAAERIQEISTLPHVALRVIEVANDPTSGARELKEAMEGDAALSARVLRCVNSSAYATRTKITNLQHAIAYLGIQQIRNLAMTASVSELFGQDETIGCYRRTELWRHLVAVGICARLIAMRSGFNNFEDMFLAGLMHDIGIILEDQHLHDSFRETIQSLAPGKTLSEVERHHLGFDHTALAAKVTKNWGFPDAVIATVRHHHGSTSYRGEDLQIIHCVEVANLICSLKKISSVGLNLVQFPKSAIAGLSLTKDDVMVLVGDLDRELALNQSLFQM
jgi:putative nucleotidyltransferase with HDIG domain